MCVSGMMKPSLFAILVGLGAASAGMAATLNESDVNGGFGATALTPTQVALGNDMVTGSLGSGSADYLRFTNLARGAQSVTLTFGLLTPGANSAGRGSGVVTVSPLAGLMNQTFSLNKSGGRNGSLTGTTTLTFNLNDNFAGGDLLFGLNQTAGNRTVTYAMSIPGNILPPPAPVPIPPAGALLLASFGGLLFWRRRAARPRVRQVA